MCLAEKQQIIILQSSVRPDPFWFLLEMGTARIPQINSNLYLMPRIIVLKFQKDQSARIKVIAQKQFCLQMDDDANDKTHTKI